MTHFNMRAIPAHFPTEAELKVRQTEYFDRRRGETKVQWQAYYLPPGGSRLRDFSIVVVNFYHGQEPQEDDVWRVRFTNRAPKLELVFADALELTHREEPVLETMVSDEGPKAEPEQGRRKYIVCSWMQQKLQQLREHFS